MGFYDLPKEERSERVRTMEQTILDDLEHGRSEHIVQYASDPDTYIRKNASLILGRLYAKNEDLREHILSVLTALYEMTEDRPRQTAIHAAGEIGKLDADRALDLFEAALLDKQRGNAVVGALKQMGAKNPGPVLAFTERFLHHPDPRVRRQVIHGIELRGRTHPQDILPLLAQLQDDAQVRNMVIHVISQISYRQGCLETVISELKKWDNRELVHLAVKKILEVHKRYEKFAALSYREARELIARSRMED